jgi:hypothetical protein
MIVENFSTSFSQIDRSSREKDQQRNLIIKWQYRLNWVVHYISLRNCKVHIILSSLWNLIQIVYILGHRACLGKYKKFEISPCVLLDHNGKYLALNSKGNYYWNNWRLNNTLLNDQSIIEEVREEMQKILESKFIRI